MRTGNSMLISRRILFALLFVTAVSACLSACSRAPAPAPKDPTMGEFYTPEEVIRLSPGERDRYCGYLETTLMGIRREADSLRTSIDSLTVRADTLRGQSIRLNAETRDLNTAVRDLRLKDKAIHSYVVKQGDNLRRVAEITLGDPTRWREIYEANKSTIGAENAALQPGSRLTIPGGGKSGETPGGAH